MAPRPAGRRKRLRLLAGLVIAVSLTGCGRQTSPQPEPVPGPASVDQLKPSMAGWLSPTPGTELSDVHALLSMPWKLAAISQDRRRITVQYVGGDGYCVKHVGYRLTREGTELRLGEYSSSTADSTCPASLQMGMDIIGLPVALDGSVQLVHIPAGESWEAHLD